MSKTVWFILMLSSSALFISACGDDSGNNSTTTELNSSTPSDFTYKTQEGLEAEHPCCLALNLKTAHVISTNEDFVCSQDFPLESWSWKRSFEEDVNNFEENTRPNSSSVTNVPITTTNSSSSETSEFTKTESSSSTLNELVYSSSVEEPLPPTFTDPRDGQTYKIIMIGSQIWMAQNLNYDYNEGTAKSFCYNDIADSCFKYGRLYTWSAAMDSAALFNDGSSGCGNGKKCSLTYPVQGVCPNGWHLPSKAEYEKLVSSVGGGYVGKVLKSRDGWEGDLQSNDSYGFSALPAGNTSSYRQFYNIGEYATFWTSVQDKDYDYYAYQFQLYSNSDKHNIATHYKYTGRSVRCIKGEGVGNAINTPNVKSSSSTTLSSSSSKIIESSSSSFLPLNSVVYGTLKDVRDGQNYKIVTIGSQTWMAQNLNYDYNEGSAKSFCYNDIADSCSKYGRLYLWSAAMDSAAKFSTAGEGCGLGKKCSPAGIIRGVCPEGWHLPSDNEWNDLFNTINGWDFYYFASTPFSVLFAGTRSDNNKYYEIGSSAYFRSASEENSLFAYYWYFDLRIIPKDDVVKVEQRYVSVGRATSYGKDFGMSVRCLKD